MGYGGFDGILVVMEMRLGFDAASFFKGLNAFLLSMMKKV